MCPVTLEPLRAEQLTPQPALAKRIAEWKASRLSSCTAEEEDSLYVF